MEKLRVLVYGTLKRGESNHFVMTGATFIQPDSFNGLLFDLGAFPAVKEGNSEVFGELYEINPEILRRLDMLEGHPTFYERKKIQTTKGIRAWVYFMESIPKNAQSIPTGIWTRTRCAKEEK